MNINDSINQPAASRGYQSVFFNLSVYDRYFYDSMFGHFCFPDGTHVEYDEFNKFQKFFMEWLLEERKKSLLTFPVLTEASLDENGEPKDKEWAEFCADIRSRGLSFFTYNSETADALSSCVTGDTAITVLDTQTNTEMFLTIEEFADKLSELDVVNKTFENCKYSIRGVNPKDSKVTYQQVTGLLKKPYTGNMYHITIDNNTLRVTEGHVFLVRGIKDSKVRELAIEVLYKDDNYRNYQIPIYQDGDTVVYKDIQEVSCHFRTNVTVYDVEMKDYHYFLANDVMTHNCCRLRNAIEENDFSYSLGAGGVETGSHSVITIDLVAVFGRGYNLEEIIKKVHKFQYAHRMLVKDGIDAGLLPAYTAGFIHLDKQFSTLGVNGLNEAAEEQGLVVGNNDDYKKWVSNILGTFKRLNKEAREIYGTKFNTELVPAENLGVKNATWDKKAGLYHGKRECYNSYLYLSESDITSIPDKFAMHGSPISDNLDGGSALHLNIARLPDKEFFLWLRKLAAKYKCNYWTTNVKGTICNTCGHYDMDTYDKCPKCGSTDITMMTRIIGYCKKISSFSEARKKEESLRFYH